MSETNNLRSLQRRPRSFTKQPFPIDSLLFYRPIQIWCSFVTTRGPSQIKSRHCKTQRRRSFVTSTFFLKQFNSNFLNSLPSIILIHYSWCSSISLPCLSCQFTCQNIMNIRHSIFTSLVIIKSTGEIVIQNTITRIQKKYLEEYLNNPPNQQIVNINLKEYHRNSSQHSKELPRLLDNPRSLPKESLRFPRTS